MTSSPRLRPAVRALVIDHNHHVLMVKLVFPNGVWWVLPGGGIEESEDVHDALRRELAEEVGLTDFSAEGVIWTRDHHFSMTSTDGVQWDGQSETVFAVRVKRFTPEPHMTVDELLEENLHECRWWSLDELMSFPESENVAPPDLVHRIATYIRDGIPQVAPHIVQHN